MKANSDESRFISNHKIEDVNLQSESAISICNLRFVI